MTQFVTATSDRENKKPSPFSMNATKAYNPNCLCSRQLLHKVAGLQISLSELKMLRVFTGKIKRGESTCQIEYIDLNNMEGE